MYILLSGYHPFDVYGDLPEHELLQKIISVQYDFDDPVWEHVSNEAKTLIQGLLQYEPSKRMSLTQYLNSEWITGHTATAVHNNVVAERIAKFNVGKQHFRTLIVAKLASNKFKASLSRSRQTRSPSISGHDGKDKQNEKDRSQAAHHTQRSQDAAAAAVARRQASGEDDDDALKDYEVPLQVRVHERDDGESRGAPTTVLVVAKEKGGVGNGVPEAEAEPSLQLHSVH